MKLKAITKHIHKTVASHDNIVAVYLFGSAETGKKRPSSDVDIAIMSRCPIGGFERIRQETMVRREYLDTRFLFRELVA